MQALEFTDSQRLQLLIIAKELYPEFATIKYGTGFGLGGEKNYLYFYKVEETIICHSKIHWFEFYMRNLNKINLNYEKIF